ncbi:PREDICTED: major royal jelly protein 1-like [Dinoponera quadriceps]|uniref:Major royal jelly protein 1-like n=1 Tax=Dinoponera quadriceps TaxID=609295 RepID=A0A6P3XWA1_DINQU|nr:PREDICTED: major royal jelly protein 1-like [Dinoponera quadriceps]
MSNVIKTLSICAGIASINVIASHVQLETVYKWKYFDYEWESESHREAAIASGDYNYTKPIIIDTDHAKDGRIFVTIIRADGVPSSLNVIGNRRGPGGPLLQPYPSWEWTKRGDCNGITSVYRVAIDPCNRLWVLDNGKIGSEVICSAQLLVFDLATDKLIKRVKIPIELSQNSETDVGRLVTPIVETHGPHCTNTTVYMADISGYGLVIYDRGQLWRLESKLFRADPAVTNYTILGESFTLQDGILGMAKHPDIPVLYFRSMSSHDMSSAGTTDLKNSRHNSKVRYHTIPDVIPSQAAAMAVSSDGILFLGLPTELSLACWNTCKPLNKDTLGIVAHDPKRLQFVSGVKIIPKYITGTNEEVWIVTDRFQKIMAGTMDFSDVNFRIMKADVAQLTAGTFLHAMTRKKRGIKGVQRTEWLSFQQLWTPRQTSRSNNYIYVPPNCAFGSTKDDSNFKQQRELRNREKLQPSNLPRRDRSALLQLYAVKFKRVLPTMWQHCSKKKHLVLPRKSAIIVFAGAAKWTAFQKTLSQP